MQQNKIHRKPLEFGKILLYDTVSVEDQLGLIFWHNSNSVYTTALVIRNITLQHHVCKIKFIITNPHNPAINMPKRVVHANVR